MSLHSLRDPQGADCQALASGEMISMQDRIEGADRVQSMRLSLPLASVARDLQVHFLVPWWPTHYVLASW